MQFLFIIRSFIKYDDSKEKLIQSDLDRLEGIPAPVPTEGKSGVRNWCLVV